MKPMARVLLACGSLLLIGAGCQTMNVKNEDTVARAVIIGLPDRDRPIVISVPPGATRTELIGGSGLYSVAPLAGNDQQAARTARSGIDADLNALFLEEPSASMTAFYTDLERYERLLDDVLATQEKRCSLRIAKDEDGMAVIMADGRIDCLKRKTPETEPAEKK